MSKNRNLADLPDSSGNINLDDNEKAQFGAGNDLQIYHDGSNSYIKDAGTGHLQVWANDLRMSNAAGTKSFLYANDGGATVINYDGSQKLSTTSTGIDVTGSVETDDGAFRGTTATGAGTPTFSFSGDTNTGLFHVTTDTLGFTTGGTERMRIDSSGKVLINRTSAIPANHQSAMLHVESPNTSSHAAAFKTLATGGGFAAATFGRNNQAGRVTEFLYSDSSTVGSVSVTSSSTSYNTSSDYRLKENVVDMDGAIDRVKALQPRRFNWIADEDDIVVDGFIAHEVSDIVPEAIHGEKDATKEEEYEVTPAVLDDDGNVVTEAVMGTRTVPDYQGIDQSKLVPLLTGALQEAIAKIEALETTVADLTTRIEALENV